MAFVLIVEAAAVGLLVAAARLGLPTRSDLISLAWVATSALITAEASMRVERWRARHRSGVPHKDLFGPWLVAAVLVCQPLTAVLLVGVLYAWMWFRVLRRTLVAAHRWVFSAATTMLGTGLAAVATGHLPLVRGAQRVWVAGLTAIGVTVTVNTVLVAVVIVLSQPGAGRRRAWGDSAGFAVEVASGSLGVLIAAGHDMSVTILFAVPVVLVLQQTLVLLVQARSQARTDPKTRLANSGWWRELVERELHRAARSGEPVAVMIADLDRFKQLNDTYGHLVGDEVLSAVAAALTEGVRPSDAVGRFGGEEFVIMLANADVGRAVATADRLRARIAALTDLTSDGTGRPHTTVSIGVAVYPDHGTTVDDLLAAADAAVYAAKHSGRNTVRVARRSTQKRDR